MVPANPRRVGRSDAAGVGDRVEGRLPRSYCWRFVRGRQSAHERRDGATSLSALVDFPPQVVVLVVEGTVHRSSAYPSTAVIVVSSSPSVVRSMLPSVRLSMASCIAVSTWSDSHGAAPNSAACVTSWTAIRGGSGPARRSTGRRPGGCWGARSTARGRRCPRARRGRYWPRTLFHDTTARRHRSGVDDAVDAEHILDLLFYRLHHAAERGDVGVDPVMPVLDFDGFGKIKGSSPTSRTRCRASRTSVA